MTGYRISERTTDFVNLAYRTEPRNQSSARIFLRSISLKDAFSPLVDDFYAAQYRDVIAFNKEQKLIRNDVDFQKWVEPRYLNAALKSLQLESYWTPKNPDGAPGKPGN